jgi:YVTN family beta-propeller protein
MNIFDRKVTASTAALWGMVVVGLWTGAWPGEAAAGTGKPLAYVTSSSKVSVIDTGNNKVVDTIPAVAHSRFGSVIAAVSPNGRYLYTFGPITSERVDYIYVTKVANHRVVARIPLDLSLVTDAFSLNVNSSAIAISPDGKQAYVTDGYCPNFSPYCSSPSSFYFATFVIDTTTNRVVRAYPGKGVTDGIAFSPDGKHVYFASFDPYLADPHVYSDSFRTYLPGYGQVYTLALAVFLDGSTRAYVPYMEYAPPSNLSNVSILDAMTGNIINTIKIGTNRPGMSLTGIAAAPNGQYVYVADPVHNSVAVIDTAANKVVQNIPVGKNPSGVAVTPDGKHVYVANQGSNNVSVIDTATRKVVSAIAVARPDAIIIGPASVAGAQ